MAQLPLSVSDGRWHHICITWTTRDGFWEAYQDGERLGTGDNLAPWHPIKPGGVIILGQEQVRAVENKCVCMEVCVCVLPPGVYSPLSSPPEAQRREQGKGRQRGSSHAIVALSALPHSSISKLHLCALESCVSLL